MVLDTLALVVKHQFASMYLPMIQTLAVDMEHVQTRICARAMADTLVRIVINHAQRDISVILEIRHAHRATLDFGVRKRRMMHSSTVVFRESIPPVEVQSVAHVMQDIDAIPNHHPQPKIRAQQDNGVHQIRQCVSIVMLGIIARIIVRRHSKTNAEPGNGLLQDRISVMIVMPDTFVQVVVHLRIKLHAHLESIAQWVPQFVPTAKLDTGVARHLHHQP
mmetsp:Transcript_1994/g.7154  ORF Transcript_1994/g.7154 Transcript_1994/m.7154 type:complete len:220 (+) Transcript_1994:987-1646(+)